MQRAGLQLWIYKQTWKDRAKEMSFMEELRRALHRYAGSTEGRENMYKLLKKRVAVSRQSTIPRDPSMELTDEEFKTFIVLVTERVRDAIGDQEREGGGGHPSGAAAGAATGPKGPSPSIAVINGWSDYALQYVWQQRMEAIRVEDESASVLATGGAPQGSSLPGMMRRASGIFSEGKEEEEEAASVGPQRGAYRHLEMRST